MTKTTIRQILRCVLLSLLVGLVLSLATFAADPRLNVSRWKLYYQIQLGMDKDQVAMMLERRGVECAITEMPGDAGDHCDFSDLWRNYAISIDRGTGRVAGKMFGFERPTWFIRIFESNRYWVQAHPLSTVA